MRRNSVLLLAALVLSITAHCQAEAPKEFPLFGSEVRALAISPNDKTLAVGDNAGEIVLWDVAAEKVTRKLKKHVDGIRALQFTREGKTLISGGTDSRVCFWSVETGELLRSVKTIGKVEDACLSKGGQLLAVSFDEGKEVQVISAITGKELRRLKTPSQGPVEGTGACAKVEFSPDGSLLATTSGGRAWPKYVGGDSTISLWNVDDWSLRASFTGDRFALADLRFSPDGKWLAGATARGKTIKLWEVPAAAPRGKGDAETIAALIKQLDSDEFGDRETAQRRLTEIGEAAKGALEKVARSDSAEMAFRAKAILKTLSHADNQPKHILPRSIFDVHSLAFSPDGKWLASGRQFNKPGNVILYELGEKPRRVVTPHQHGAWVVAFTNDGKRLFTTRRDGQLTMWKVPQE